MHLYLLIMKQYQQKFSPKDGISISVYPLDEDGFEEENKVFEPKIKMDESFSES